MTYLGINWLDFFINVAALAIAPGVLAALGGHLAAETIQDVKRQRKIKWCFWAIFVFGMFVTSWQQFRLAQSELARETKETWDQAIVAKILFRPVEPPTIASMKTAEFTPKLKMTSSVAAIAPNGIANAAPNFGSQTVNNGPLPPNISWAIDNTTPLKQGITNPASWVSISIDRPLLDPKFAVVCDRPCKAVDGRVIAPHGGYIQDRWGSLPDVPNVAAFVINGPNPMSADDGYLACVESGDHNPVKILGVRILTIKKPQP